MSFGDIPVAHCQPIVPSARILHLTGIDSLAPAAEIQASIAVGGWVAALEDAFTESAEVGGDVGRH